MLVRKNKLSPTIIKIWWDFALHHGLLLAFMLKAGNSRLFQTPYRQVTDTIIRLCEWETC